jgi:F-type H+-transporting ATPase subunit a
MIGLSMVASALPETHIAPQAVFHVGPLAITNSILYGWLITAIAVIGLIVIARRVTVRPKGGIYQFVEVVAEFMTGTITDAFEQKERAAKYVPFFVTVFFFVLVNNLAGLIPGTGESLTAHGNPLLRPMTADFNTTLAMAAIMMGLVYFSSVREVGFKAYFGHFFMGSLKNPIYLFIGLIEMITDITRVVSLSLRLFLNVAIVETIVVVFAWLGHILAPVTAVPFYFLDMFDALLQAYIFVLLGAMYLAIAVNHVTEHEAETDLTEEALPAKINTSPEQA